MDPPRTLLRYLGGGSIPPMDCFEVLGRGSRPSRDCFEVLGVGYLGVTCRPTPPEAIHGTPKTSRRGGNFRGFRHERGQYMYGLQELTSHLTRLSSKRRESPGSASDEVVADKSVGSISCP
jgi:hypothetical protein